MFNFHTWKALEEFPTDPTHGPSQGGRHWRCDQTSARAAGGPLMPFGVFLIDDVARDLDEVYKYIGLHDAPSS